MNNLSFHAYYIPPSFPLFNFIILIILFDIIPLILIKFVLNSMCKTVYERGMVIINYLGLIILLSYHVYSLINDFEYLIMSTVWLLFTFFIIIYYIIESMQEKQ